MTDRLDEYRSRRDARRTPEPVPAPRRPSERQAAPEQRNEPRFVIQQHHARSLHWDVRLERDGVLVSFAVPRGLPREPARNALARPTEDHPLEYLDFAGEIPAGEYGGGLMTIFDRGTYEADKWRDDEIGVTFHGERTRGRYVFFRIDDREWRVRRMVPAEPGWEPMPETVLPMLATPAAGPPPDDRDWGYEMNWGGRRVLTYISGGRVRLTDGDGADVTPWYPEIRALGPALAPAEAVLDGEIVTFDGPRPDPGLLARRTAPKDPAAARRAADRTPVHLMVYDLLWLEGHATTELVRYAERRELLDGLSLAGPHWQTPPFFSGGGAFAQETARAQGLPGVIGKRLDSPYLPGRASRLWIRLPPR